VPPIPFRHRILLSLLLLGAVPSALLVAGLAIVLLRTNPARASQEALRPVRESGRELLRVLDTTRMGLDEHRALRAHVRALESAIIRSQQGFEYSRLKTGGLALVLLALGVLLLYAAVLLSRSISRQLATPIDELVGWMARIRRNEGLPPEGARRGAPEFAVLRGALRETEASLAQARSSELESERLRAFL
jgi:hypothetical protein